jgi:hypothetical protein
MGPPAPRAARALGIDCLRDIETANDDQLESLIRDCVEVRGTSSRTARARSMAHLQLPLTRVRRACQCGQEPSFGSFVRRVDAVWRQKFNHEA